ncbi:hypothetical protein [Sphingopyxis flava]|uniref:hypothetical protein n=1 Tax=Sphingopyxis flava TaxID=1507287 RepID=UPI0015915222|nr:hypothetical protein [Sphingopyxis flava]
MAFRVAHSESALAMKLLAGRAATLGGESAKPGFQFGKEPVGVGLIDMVMRAA